MDQLKVILSRGSGPLSQQEKIKEVEQALRSANLEYDLAVTSSGEEGTQLAYQAAQQGWPIIVAAGGDGTINGVANGLMQAAGDNQAGTLGILPIGTANDLADMLNIPRDLTSASRQIAAGQTRIIDVGQVNGHYFVN